MKAHSPIPLVLCEGKEDRLVIEAIAKHAGLEGKLAFEHYDGESSLRRYLGTLKVRPDFCRGEFSRVLVTRDADSDSSGAWASVHASIQSVFSIELNTPGIWVPTEGGVPIAAWIIPGPDQAGMIESLCLDAARTRSPDLFECLDPLMDCLEGLQGKRSHEKVRFAIWTIIAQGAGARKRLSLERAIQHVPLDWDAEAFAPLRKILVEIGP